MARQNAGDQTQSADVAQATAGICNAERTCHGETGGHDGLVHTFSVLDHFAQRLTQFTMSTSASTYLRKARTAWRLWRTEGWYSVARVIRLKTNTTRSAASNDRDYTAWIARYDSLDVKRLRTLTSRAYGLAWRPRFSVLVPVYNPPLALLDEAVSSVRMQVYPDWQLILVDDASTDPQVWPRLQTLATGDSRIRVGRNAVNGHISATSNAALALADGDFVALLDQDDLLTPDALLRVAEALQTHPDAQILYSDEDKLDAKGRRFDPYFKSDWNLELFLSQNFVSHLGVYRRELVQQVGGFRLGYEGSQDYDLALRCIACIGAQQIVHIPYVLYHWRVLPGSTALAPGEKPYAQIAGQRALSDFVASQGWAGTVEALSNGYYRFHAHLPSDPPLVSLVIPTRNQAQFVTQCIDSILGKTTYRNFEILLVDNGSDEPEALAKFAEYARHPQIRVLRDDRPFNYSALNNAAVRQANGELVGLINNDIEVIEPGWLGELVSLALREGVGAVGAKLLYPDGLVQHAGVVTGLGGVAGHLHWKRERDAPGYFGRAVLTQALSAVTAACLVVRKAIYEEVGGLDEEHLTVAFNDVDFCLRVREAGYRNVWTPWALLYHHESASRGADTSGPKAERFAREVAYMHRAWGRKLAHDPFYNPNLCLEHETSWLAWPPRLPEHAPAVQG
ncbi:glycosyltransferase family 2 protein [Xylophilus sp.]|uniref:glycosyltransferase family 2 protein n=1 Tax=Xylophilus sp. TaxID=2653893 RepID=UPI0013BA4CE7|nr:glycosyltransferase family 2 protein [Xylophilus sp.]KAF1046227.1 MAG: putative glycosyltransferase EpsE [Xylophilus sp.]